MSETKPTHGGRRKGAGRPKLGKVEVTLWLKPETNKSLSHIAKVGRTTKSEVADRILHIHLRENLLQS